MKKHAWILLASAISTFSITIFAGDLPIPASELFAAIETNNPELLTTLLNARGDVTAKREPTNAPYPFFHPETLLHASLKKHRSPAIAHILITHNACIHEKDESQKTPLHMVAASPSHIETLSLLLELKADIHALAGDKCTPLHDAAYYGNDKACSLLLDNKADVNYATENGITPLHYAAQKKSYFHYCNITSPWSRPKCMHKMELERYTGGIRAVASQTRSS